MGGIRRKVTVALSQSDIKEAIAAWLNAQPPFDDFWKPEDISISAEIRRVGYGMQEHQVAEPVIAAEKRL